MLFAIKGFAEKMKAAIEERVDSITSGAGISRDMYTWGKCWSAGHFNRFFCKAGQDF